MQALAASCEPVFAMTGKEDLDRSEIDLSPKRSECERSNANWDRSKIDLNEYEHFLKANWDRSQIDPA